MACVHARIQSGVGVYTDNPPPPPITGGFCKNNIRIYYECEGRIEKSVPRIAVWHHEACRVMTNCDPEGQIFLSFPHTNKRLYFLLSREINAYQKTNKSDINH